MKYFPTTRPESPEELYRQALSAARDEILCDGVTIFRLAPEQQTVLQVVATQTIERDLIRGVRLEKGQGVAGGVVEEGSGRIVNDVPPKLIYYAGSDPESGFECRSILCCPMRFDGHVVGVLELINKTDESPFTEAELEGIQTLADAAAGNWRREESAARRETFHELCSMVFQRLDVQGVAVFTVHTRTGTLEGRFSITGRQTCLDGIRLNVGQGIAGWVAQHVESVLVSDVQQDERFFKMVDALNLFQSGSILAVPIVHGGRLEGVLEAVNAKGGSALTKEDQTTLEAIAVELAGRWVR